MINTEGLRPGDQLEAGLSANSLRTILDFDNVPQDRTVLGLRERTLPVFLDMDPAQAGQVLTEMLDSGSLSYDEAVVIADELNLLQRR